jgi:hypothetical protein
MYLWCHVRATVDDLDDRQREKTHHFADTHPRRDCSVAAMVVVAGADDRKNTGKNKEMCV